MTSELVLIIGASGFTGSHVIAQLLEKGYRVRGTVRSGRADAMKAAYAKYGDLVDIVVVNDLVAGDFTDALKGVHAVIYVASVKPASQPAQTTIDVIVEGALNLVRQAYASGVRRVSYISAVTAFVQPGQPVYKRLVRSTDWNPLTEEDAHTYPNPMMAYSISKALAEKALLKFAEEHKDFNLVTIGPTIFIGPLTPEHLESTKPGDTPTLSSSICIYNFLTGPPTVAGPLTYGYVDVRDVARAIVAGIKPKVPGNHRLLLTSLTWFDNADILDHIAAVRPDLKHRLIKAEASDWKEFVATEDVRKTLEVLGMGEMTPWKKTVEDGLESVLELEKVWKEKGVDVDEVLGKNPTLKFWKMTTTSRVEVD